MAANKRRSRDGVRSLEVYFTPWEGRFTSANVLTVDYSGDRRTARRIGSIRLRIGRDDLVGLTPSEVTWRCVDELHKWLSAERSILALASPTPPGRAAAPAPPEGVTGAVLKGTLDNPLPGL